MPVWISVEIEVNLQLLARDFRQTDEIFVIEESREGEFRLILHKVSCKILDVLGRMMGTAAFTSVLS